MVSSSHVLYVHFVGGADKNAVVFHKESEQIVATLKGHTKKVTSVVYHPKEVKCLLMHTNSQEVPKMLMVLFILEVHFNKIWH